MHHLIETLQVLVVIFLPVLALVVVTMLLEKLLDYFQGSRNDDDYTL